MGVESYGRWAGLVGKSNGSAVHTMFLSTLTGRELPLLWQYIRDRFKKGAMADILERAGLSISEFRELL